MKVIGENIRRRRREMRMSQAELGSILGVGKSTICEWEAGKRAPELAMVEKLALALRLPPAALAGWGERARPALETDSLLNKKYSLLDEHGRKLVNAVVDLELERVSVKLPGMDALGRAAKEGRLRPARPQLETLAANADKAGPDELEKALPEILKDIRLLKR